MPASPSDLFVFLDSLAISTETVDHPPLFTVEESRRLRGKLRGLHAKNLFLKDKKDRHFLVVAEEAAEIDLKRLHERIGARGRLSFGSAERLLAILGVTPGSVTPFALLNDRPPSIELVLDDRFAAAEAANFHPLVNTATTTISGADLLRFLAATGHAPRLVDFSAISIPTDL
jgi:Ala-tRNA(Pro) deacylase